MIYLPFLNTPKRRKVVFFKLVYHYLIKQSELFRKRREYIINKVVVRISLHIIIINKKT